MLSTAACHTIGSVIATAAPRIKSSYRIETIGTITKEGNMKTTASKCISALLMTTILAGCGMIPTQNLGMTRAQPVAPASASEQWAKMVELDRQSVSHGYMPPEVIRYDLQIAQMIPEGEAIVASHDKAKARVWSEKLNSIQTARNKAIEKSTAIAMAKSNATPHPWSNAKPDPCLSPMGKNICSSSPAQQNGVNYTVGPGGLGATVGGISVGPGGLGGVIGGQ